MLCWLSRACRGIRQTKRGQLNNAIAKSPRRHVSSSFPLPPLELHTLAEKLQRERGNEARGGGHTTSLGNFCKLGKTFCAKIYALSNCSSVKQKTLSKKQHTHTPGAHTHSRAYTHLRRASLAGKHSATANKIRQRTCRIRNVALPLSWS